MDKKVLNTMFDNLLHIWTKTRFGNAKMKESIYGSVNGVYVFNLIKTVEKLEEAKKILAEATSKGKKVLFVATKLQARDAFVKLAEETGHYFVAEKWVPGLLTNYKTIKRRIATYIKLNQDSENGVFDVLTKKEKATRLLELEKLDKAYRWLKNMEKRPDMVFVVDGAYEKQALTEAAQLKIPSIALLNTNGDIDTCGNYVPANTNSVKGMEYIAAELKPFLGTAEVKKVVKKVVTAEVSAE